MTFFKLTALLLMAVLLLSLSCTAGNQRWDEKPAGFWAGLWHGFIILFSFIISLFTDKVQIYEINNAGGWYDFGFLLGAMIFLGGSNRTHCHQRKRKKEKDWDEVGRKVEAKVKAGIQSWMDDSEDKKRADEWKEIGKKIEEKIKRELKNWADKE